MKERGWLSKSATKTFFHVKGTNLKPAMTALGHSLLKGQRNWERDQVRWVILAVYCPAQGLSVAIVEGAATTVPSG